MHLALARHSYDMGGGEVRINLAHRKGPAHRIALAA